MQNPPDIVTPSVRKRLIDAFGPINTWGEHSPEAMQAVLDTLDAETVPAVESVDDLRNVSAQNIPYVLKGADQAPSDLDDQQIPLGRDVKKLSKMVSGVEQSIDSRKLDAVDTVEDISNPSVDDQYFVTNLDTTVQVTATDPLKLQINGRATVDSEPLPDPDYFEPGEKIEIRESGAVKEVQA